MWIYFAALCKESSAFDMIEFEHLVEIRECIFDELVVAFSILSGQQLRGRRNKKKIASDIYIPPATVLLMV